MAARPLLAFDFDGTLAPIVARPDDARLAHGIAESLARLAAELPVAIVSGRAVDDLMKRLPFVPPYVVGNHGAEDPLAGGAPPAALDAMRERLLAQADVLGAVGVSVEDKGYSLALHYRLAPDHAAAAAQVAGVVADLPGGLEAYPGKLVMNVVGAGAPDKGVAVARLVERSGASRAVFIGDDVNDEPVFAVAGADWLTVRVGRDDRPSLARFYVENTDEVAHMLERMVRLLGASAAAA
ncbi:trehalose-phosphatase [Schlegelella sp. ID0723]|uniref:Trehalose 6-phosphate phosphatase n=2 Tax=Piscinibacter koreensis TaxID=2742824 RepID=A0A7Y6NR44_9BURK|nr:trehalose-phosphatase [Schlegelella koreensis]NUZ07769.1 trehalose-phosphatase [Schlegelella koreensis]